MASTNIENIDELISIAKALTAPGKGILASDESPNTLGKRLEKAGVANSEENRRQYRELFYTAPIGVGISGAIMHPEALLQSASDGTSFVQCLADRGVIPGVKVDEGLRPLGAAGPGESDTKGLEGLADRCREYRNQGARFAKWRAALRVPPSEAAIEINAAQLAEYAEICHAAGLVPIVEPELLIDGDHTADAAEAATIAAVSACITHLLRRNVPLEAVLLKPQMVIPGIEHAGPRPGPEEVAERTLRALKRCVPPAVPGIMFLSGGQSEAEATRNLNAINATKGANAPWALSFSFGRALQASVLKLWAEDKADIEACRKMAAALAEANGKATLAEFQEGGHPSITSPDAMLQESFRGWTNAGK